MVQVNLTTKDKGLASSAKDKAPGDYPQAHALNISYALRGLMVGKNRKNPGFSSSFKVQAAERTVCRKNAAQVWTTISCWAWVIPGNIGRARVHFCASSLAGKLPKEYPIFLKQGC